MKIALGADHGGYELKEVLKSLLDELGFEYKDFGTYSVDSVDYPDFGTRVAETVAAGECERGILVCGTGIGMSIVANKVPGIRCALVHDTFSARATREHNDSNILAMGARVIGQGLALDVARVWLETKFLGGRHARRLDKIRGVEQQYGREEGENGCKTSC